MVDLLEHETEGFSEVLPDRLPTNLPSFEKKTVTNYMSSKSAAAQSVLPIGNMEKKIPRDNTSISRRWAEESTILPDPSIGAGTHFLGEGAPTIQALQILRSHYADKILEYLARIEPAAGSPEMEFFVSGLLRTIRQMRDNCPEEPLTDIALALYDSITFEKRWFCFTSNQYSEARRIITEIASRKHLGYDAIKRAIVELEEAGFDTTPYQLGSAVEYPAG